MLSFVGPDDLQVRLLISGQSDNQQFRSVVVVDTGNRHDYRQWRTERIDADTSLSVLGFHARIVSAVLTNLSAFHILRIARSRRRLAISSITLGVNDGGSNELRNRTIDRFSRPVITPPRS